MGTTALRNTKRDGFVCVDVAGPNTEFERARIPDLSDQRTESSEVGHQAERRLFHTENGVVGHNPDVAGEGELETGTDGVTLHRGDGDEVRVSQECEPLLVLAYRAGRGQVRATKKSSNGFHVYGVVEHGPIQPGGEGWSFGAKYQHADSVGHRAPKRGQRAPHRRGLRIPAFRRTEHDLGDRPFD